MSLACSKRSDSGERCEEKKAMKSRGELEREVREPLTDHPTSHLTSPPLSQRPAGLLFVVKMN